jgi:hypothetical protein
VTEPFPQPPAADDPSRRPFLRKVQSLTDPPAAPPPTVVTIAGWAVVRDNDGSPRRLQQAGNPSGHPPDVRYTIVYDGFADARLEAEEQLLRAVARGTYEDDARHVLWIRISNCEMRDFRQITMPRAAVEAAAHQFDQGHGDEQWWRPVEGSEGGIVLPWPAVGSITRSGCFVLVTRPFMDRVCLAETTERIPARDLKGGKR